MRKLSPRARLAVALSAAAVAVGAALLFAAGRPAHPLFGAVTSGTVNMNVSFGQQATSVIPYTIPAAAQFTYSYSNGTSALQFDTLYAKEITLSGAPTTIDLTNFIDAGGNAGTAFARVREWIVWNPDTNATHTVTVSAGASNGWTVLPPVANAQTVQPNNGIYHLNDPQSSGTGVGMVVTSSSKTVTFNPGSNTVTIFVIAAGGSAAMVPIVFLLPFGRRLRRLRNAA